MNPIIRLWIFGKKKFLNKEFITFCIIGVLNTFINWIVLKVCYYFGFNDLDTIDIIISTTIAFLIASTFSYFANNFVTFKNKKASVNKFLQSLVVFGIRLFCTLTLTAIFVTTFKAINLGNIWTGQVAPIISSVLMIPLFYLFLAKVLKEKTEKII